MKHIVAGGGTGGTEEVVRVGRPKCRAFTCLALLWITATFASLPSFENLKLTEEVVTQETLWLVGALAPSIVLTCLACFYRLTEQPREYHAGSDLGKLHSVSPARRTTKAEALQAIDTAPLRFAGTWDELRTETREL